MGHEKEESPAICESGNRNHKANSGQIKGLGKLLYHFKAA